MKVLAYGDIMDSGKSVFTTVAKKDATRLILTFHGFIRNDNPYNHLSNYLEKITDILMEEMITEILIDFTDLKFCNSNGFYFIMDTIDLVYNNTNGPVIVRRLKEDDWQQETLPILLGMDDNLKQERTVFEEIEV